MRFGLIHRIMTHALAALGVLAIVSTGTMAPAVTGLVLAGMVAAMVTPERWQSRPAMRSFGRLAPILLFSTQAMRLLLGSSALDITIEFAALLQVIRVATRRGAAEDQQIIVLALLHFVAGTVLGGGLSYGLCFVGFLVVAPGALVLSHLRREVEGNYRQGARDRTGLPVDVPRILRSRRVVGRGFLAATCLLSLPILLFTAALFVLFPRVGLSLLLLSHPRQGRMVGFSDHVDLGEVGVLRADPSIALRFTVPDLTEPPPPRLTLRLRGTAFDSYDGRAWSRSIADKRAPVPLREIVGSFPIHRGGTSTDRYVTIDLEPIDPPVVFLPPRTVALSVKQQQQSVLGDTTALQRGPEGEIRYVGADTHGLHYEAFFARDREPLREVMPEADRARYLSVPAAMPRRFAELAHAWADDQATPYLKAKAIEEHLKREFAYDMGSPSGGTAQPLDHFLFESKRGHCEFFSTAMAMMLRELAIPSRNVTGFVGGTYNRFGHYYAVREGDAHSWVEAYVDAPVESWVTFDPTPTAAAQPLHETTGAWVYFRDLLEAMSQRWNRYVVGYDLKTQVNIFQGASARYNELRAKAGVDHGALGTLTRGRVVAGLFLVGSAAAYAALRAWQRRRKAAGDVATSPKRSPDLERATSLYRALEAALSVHGIARPLSVPPLRHAESLRERTHPLADEVVGLTEVYLGVRFGGRPLSDDARKDFELRIRALRDAKLEAPESAA